MNNPVTRLFRFSAPYGHQRLFRVFFYPDKNQDDFIVGMSFTILSVNRQTGEVQFALEPADIRVPPENSSEKHYDE